MQKSTLDQSLGSYLGWFGLFAIRAIVGYRAAAGIVKLRSADGASINPEAVIRGTGPGEWRPTPPAFASMDAT